MGLALKLHAKKDLKDRNKKPANSALGTRQITELARVTVITGYSTLVCNKDTHQTQKVTMRSTTALQIFHLDQLNNCNRILPNSTSKHI